MNWNDRFSSRFGARNARSNRLYRNRENGVIAGVCAGIADYFGFDLTITRVIVVLGTIFFWPFLVVVYFILALMLEPRPDELRRSRPEDEDLARRVRAEPHATLSSVRHRFRELDQRLQRLEKYVISDRFKLDREFEGLKEQ
jgi:phage shock protein C